MKTSHWHGGVKITARSRRGGGLVGALVALVVLVAVARFLGGAAERALVGVQESAAAANTLVAGAVALVLALGAVAGGWWLVAGRHRAARQDEIAAEHARAVSTDVAARQVERARARHLEHERRAGLPRATSAPTTVDRLVALPGHVEGRQ